MMCTPLSSQRNLDDIKKEARNVLQLEWRDAATLRRYYSIDSLAGLSQARLDAAQYIIARELGYGSWWKPKEHLDTTISSMNTEQ
jgi:hypothetical protein